MYLKVQWSIFSALERRTVAKFETEGRAKLKKHTSGALAILILSSFESATEALAADPKFLKLVSRRRATEASTAAADARPHVEAALRESYRRTAAYP